MSELLQPTSRRTLLQRGAAVVAGLLGMRLADAESPPPAPPPSPPPPPPPELGARALKFYARVLRTQAHGQRPGKLPASTGRINSQADLFNRPDGTKVGEFYATCFGPEAPLQALSGTAAIMELQTLRVSDGTLFGMGCAGPTHGGERFQAILGGTGRFAGARGSYVMRPGPQAKGAGTIEFVLNLQS